MKKNSNKNILIWFELVLLIMIIIINMEYAYYARLHPEYFMYNENNILHKGKPILKECTDYNYVCVEEWIVGTDPYIKQKAPLLYFMITHQIKFVFAYLVYFFITQHNKIKRILKKLITYLKENDL